MNGLRRAGEAVLARPWHLGLGAFAAGLLLGPVERWAVVAAAAGALAAGVLARRLGVALAVAVPLLLGGVAAEERLQSLERTALRPGVAGPVELRVVVLEPARPRRFGGWTAPARIMRGVGAGERIVLRVPARVRDPGARVGDVVLVHGRLERLAPWEGHQRVRGAHAALVVERAARTGSRRGGAAGALDGVRRRAERAAALGLDREAGALARGMVLGDDAGLDDRTRTQFQDSGLAHLLAASGQNVALVGALAVGALGVLGLGLRGRLLGALALVALYVPVAGGGPSILRAGVMGGAALVAGLAGRPGSRVHALLLAAAVTLVLNPRASADVGWQLSFAAVIAIALLCPRASAALRRRGVPGPLADAIGLSAAATVGTAPLLALHFERLSLVSLPANLVAAPAVAPVVWLGTGSALLGQLAAVPDPVAGVAHEAARTLNALAAIPLAVVATVAEVAAAAPGARVAVGPGGALGLLGALAAAAGLIAFRRPRVLAAAGVIAVVAAVVWPVATAPRPPAGFRASFLDVGQGDATLLQHGEHAVLVDTGPPGGGIVQRLRASGVRRLDLLVLTHASLDHDGETATVLDALPVAAVLDGGTGTGGPARRRIVAAQRREDARRVVPDAGQVLRVGPMRLEVLWPRAADAPVPGADVNDRALVLRVRGGGLTLLLTADAESHVTLPLAPGPVDVLKVAHHGSADPTLPALLTELRPALAAIEVGGENRYGHPAPSTLAALRTVPRVVRTDRDGTIRVTADRGRVRVETDA